MSQNLLTLPTFPSNAIMDNLKEYSHDPLGFLTRCAREFGEIVPLQLGDQFSCLLTNPDHITEVLRDRILFVKGRDTRRLQVILGEGLLTSEGDFWQRQRRLSQPVFHQQRIESYATMMVNYTEKTLQTWHDGEVRDVHDEMMRLTLNIVMKTIFDQEVTNGEAAHVAHALDEAMSWFTNFNADRAAEEGKLHPEEANFQSAIDLLDQTLYAMIHQRRNGEMKGDLLSMLMQVEDADDGSKMSDRQLRDEIATMILAGHETTANALSWTWMLLSKHPNIREKLIQELRTVLNGRSPTLVDLPQLTYTGHVVKEVMRLYPPATDVNREATQDCEIGGYLIPKGCTLIMSQWVMHRHPRYFSESEVFKPERWENDLEKQLPRGVYFPFSDGPRICIGKSFALMEAVLIVATIAQQFELELVPNQKIELQPSITLRPKYGIQTRFKKL